MNALNFKNLNKTDQDPNQIWNRSFDGSSDSIRVSVIDGVQLNVDKIQMPEFKMESTKETVIQEIRVPEIVKEVQIERIEIPVYIPQVEYRILEVEKPIVVTEYKTIEVPVIIKEIQIEQVEKQVYKTPKIVVACMILQVISTISMLIYNITK